MASIRVPFFPWHLWPVVYYGSTLELAPQPVGRVGLLEVRWRGPSGAGETHRLALRRAGSVSGGSACPRCRL